MKLRGLLVTSIALVLAGAVGAEEDSKKALDKLKGSWEITAMTVDGNDNDNAKGDTLTIEGEKWSVKAKNEDMEGTLKVGTKDKLLTMDIAFSKGGEAGKTALGLYEMKDGTLKLCVSMPGESDRPADLSATAGSKRMLIVFKKK